MTYGAIDELIKKMKNQPKMVLFSPF